MTPADRQAKLAAAEARAASLETALREIAECAEDCIGVEDTTLREEWVRDIARAALAASAEDDGGCSVCGGRGCPFCIWEDANNDIDGEIPAAAPAEEGKA